MISFCTAVKNRLHHVRQTLPANIQATAGCKRQFVLLDYGSTDGLEEWVKSNCLGQISSGILTYAQVLPPPTYFAHSHAKNIAHKIASGEILCNVDADNYLTTSYVEDLVGVMAAKNILYCSTSEDHRGTTGCCGRIAARREHFHGVNGYDEDILGWAGEDADFRVRCIQQHHLDCVISDPKLNLCIHHDDEDRVRHLHPQHRDTNADYEIREEKTKRHIREQSYLVNVRKNWGSATCRINFDELLTM